MSRPSSHRPHHKVVGVGETSSPMTTWTESMTEDEESQWSAAPSLQKNQPQHQQQQRSRKQHHNLPEALAQDAEFAQAWLKFQNSWSDFGRAPLQGFNPYGDQPLSSAPISQQTVSISTTAAVASHTGAASTNLSHFLRQNERVFPHQQDPTLTASQKPLAGSTVQSLHGASTARCIQSHPIPFCSQRNRRHLHEQPDSSLSTTARGNAREDLTRNFSTTTFHGGQPKSTSVPLDESIRPAAFVGGSGRAPSPNDTQTSYQQPQRAPHHHHQQQQQQQQQQPQHQNQHHGPQSPVRTPRDRSMGRKEQSARTLPCTPSTPISSTTSLNTSRHRTNSPDKIANSNYRARSSSRHRPPSPEKMSRGSSQPRPNSSPSSCRPTAVPPHYKNQSPSYQTNPLTHSTSPKNFTTADLGQYPDDEAPLQNRERQQQHQQQQHSRRGRSQSSRTSSPDKTRRTASPENHHRHPQQQPTTPRHRSTSAVRNARSSTGTPSIRRRQASRSRVTPRQEEIESAAPEEPPTPLTQTSPVLPSVASPDANNNANKPSSDITGLSDYARHVRSPVRSTSPKRKSSTIDFELPFDEGDIPMTPLKPARLAQSSSPDANLTPHPSGFATNMSTGAATLMRRRGSLDNMTNASTGSNSSSLVMVGNHRRSASATPHRARRLLMIEDNGNNPAIKDDEGSVCSSICPSVTSTILVGRRSSTDDPAPRAPIRQGSMHRGRSSSRGVGTRRRTFERTAGSANPPPTNVRHLVSATKARSVSRTRRPSSNQDDSSTVASSEYMIGDELLSLSSPHEYAKRSHGRRPSATSVQSMIV